MTRILVVANETIGSKKLIDAVRTRHEGVEDAQFFLVVPRSRPRHGNVVYDEAVRDAAEVRVTLAQQFMARESIEVVGEVGDDDPFNATLDAVSEWHPDEIIISTLPATSSGWLRRDLIERVQAATGLPVEHVQTDLSNEGLSVDVTLVVANRTVATDELISCMKKRAEDGERLFIIVVPQDSGDGLAARAARTRLSQTLETLRESGLVCAGFIGNPDPFEATMNALQTFTVNDIVISTYAETRSGWLRGDLIERVRNRTSAPVEHVVVTFDKDNEKDKAKAA